MAISKAQSKLARPIRLGLVGGGSGSFIGPVHRAAAQLDGLFELSAGVFSSRPDVSQRTAAELFVPRGYGSVEEMLEQEAAREDGIDAVAVMTPNDSHFKYASAALQAGLDVICDKPLTNDVDSAVQLSREADQRNLTLLLTHNYSGYPMIREARAAVEAGELGALLLVDVCYAQGSLSRKVEEDTDNMGDGMRWRLEQARGGKSLVLGDIGVHAHQLLSFVAGRRIVSVLADVGGSIPGRKIDDTAQVIFKLDDGTRGNMLVTKVATGAQNVLTLNVYGEKAGLSWNQANANDLKVSRASTADEIRTRGLPDLYAHAKRATRIPVGHPEAFHEAFANVYDDFAELVAARLTGVAADPLAKLSPNGWSGVDGLAFIDACLKSTQTGTWVDVEQFS